MCFAAPHPRFSLIGNRSVIKILFKAGSGLLLALVLGAGPATEPATRSAFADDAVLLGSAEFSVRDAATRRLWWRGESAVPALREVVTGQNPEAAERARI